MPQEWLPILNVNGGRPDSIRHFVCKKCLPMRPSQYPGAKDDRRGGHVPELPPRGTARKHNPKVTGL
jgi:hypothetical protein